MNCMITLICHFQHSTREKMIDFNREDCVLFKDNNGANDCLLLI